MSISLYKLSGCEKSIGSIYVPDVFIVGLKIQHALDYVVSVNACSSTCRVVRERERREGFRSIYANFPPLHRALSLSLFYCSRQRANLNIALQIDD